MRAAEVPKEKARLLLVDDEIAVIRFVQAILERAHFEVVTCSSGEEALALLENINFNCIITDAVMQGMSGYDLAQAVRADPRLSEIPIVMLTHKRHRQDLKKAVQVGITDYVFKPIDEHLLLEKVESLLKHPANRAIISSNEKRHPSPSMDSSNILAGPGPRYIGAELSVGCKVTAVSESNVTLRIPFALEPRAELHLRGGIFDEAGMRPPTLRILRCSKTPQGAEAPTALTEYPYEAVFDFVGLSQEDQSRLRTWIERQKVTLEG